MNQPAEHRYSGPVTVFHGRRLPEAATPTGYSALIDAFDLTVPLPRTMLATGSHHRIKENGGWRILSNESFDAIERANEDIGSPFARHEQQLSHLDLAA